MPALKIKKKYQGRWEMGRKIPTVQYVINKNKKRKNPEITTYSRSMKEYNHMILIITYPQRVLRKTTLMQTDEYPGTPNKLEKWTRRTIQNYSDMVFQKNRR